MPSPDAAVRPTGENRLHRYGPIGVLVLVALLTVPVAYWQLFSTFTAYDDEGYVLRAIGSFADGHTLYDEIFVQYGPFPFELWGALSSVTGHRISTDVGRLIVTGLRVTIPFVCALTVWRLTSQIALAVIAQLVTFALLWSLIPEPMHPGGLVALLSAGLGLAVAWLRPGGRWAGVTVGLLLAAMLCTKVNVGVLGIAGVVLALALGAAPFRPSRRLSWVLVGLVLLLPLVLMRELLDLDWAQWYLVTEVAAMLGIVLVGTAPGTGRRADLVDARGFATWGAVALATGTAACVGAVMALGSTPGAIWHTMIQVAASQVRVSIGPAQFTSASVVVSLAGLAGALYARGWLARRPEGAPASRTLGLVRVVTGGLTFMALSGISQLWLPGTTPGFTIGLALAWLCVLPSSTGKDAVPVLVRLLIACVAVLETLQAFPVAGTQLAFGSVLLVVVAALVTFEGCRELIATSEDQVAAASTLRPILSVFAVGLAIVLVASPGVQSQRAYALGTPLPFSGASRIRLAPATVQEYTGLVGVIRQRCQTLFSEPGMASFNLWSGVPTPTEVYPTVWWSLVETSVQRRMIAEMRRAPRPCVVRNQGLVDAWVAGQSQGLRGPLAAYIGRAFVPGATFGTYELLVPAEG